MGGHSWGRVRGCRNRPHANDSPPTCGPSATPPASSGATEATSRRLPTTSTSNTATSWTRPEELPARSAPVPARARMHSVGPVPELLRPTTRPGRPPHNLARPVVDHPRRRITTELRDPVLRTRPSSHSATRSARRTSRTPAPSIGGPLPRHASACSASRGSGMWVCSCSDQNQSRRVTWWTSVTTRAPHSPLCRSARSPGGVA